MELDDSGFPQPTGELEELEADALVLALGQESDLGLLERTAGVEIEDDVVRVGEDLMTGHPGVFAGGDIVPAERTVTAAVGHGRVAAARDRRLAARRARRPGPAGKPASLDALNPWYYDDAPRTVRPKLEPPAARRRSTRSRRASTRPRRSSRPGAACRAGPASRATTATASAPTTR